MDIFQCYSTPRSGHHSVLHWIMHQHNYVTKHITPTIINRNRFEVVNDKYKAILYDNRGNQDQPELPTFNKSANRILVAYEGIEKIVTLQIKHQIQATQIIILRDFFNTAASIITKLNNIPTTMIDTWTDCALGILENRGYFINYNLYHQSQLYRSNICVDLNLHFTDFGTNYIPTSAQGSSFTGRNKLDKSQLNQRWRTISQKKLQSWIKTYPYQIDLSRQIFGNIDKSLY